MGRLRLRGRNGGPVELPGLQLGRRRENVHPPARGAGAVRVDLAPRPPLRHRLGELPLLLGRAARPRPGQPFATAQPRALGQPLFPSRVAFGGFVRAGREGAERVRASVGARRGQNSRDWERRRGAGPDLRLVRGRQRPTDLPLRLLPAPRLCQGHGLAAARGPLLGLGLGEGRRPRGAGRDHDPRPGRRARLAGPGGGGGAGGGCLPREGSAAQRRAQRQRPPKEAPPGLKGPAHGAAVGGGVV
mmetsp:Transcript_68633/g.155232  ORF Transcript_68633/g.155232 Transcript_68633/m.155232 type:complete len:245 (+) Transcript_68633:863-1597(+)